MEGLGGCLGGSGRHQIMQIRGVEGNLCMQRGKQKGSECELW